MSEFAQHIADGIHRWLGLAIQPSQQAIAMRAMEKAAAELGWGSHPGQWALRLQDKLSEDEVRTLARHITIGETYFFREKPAMDFFRQIIIPEIIKRRKLNQTPYRIWSAACSSGEEPYTLAMLLQDHLPNFSASDATILATDINPDALKKARNGAYTAWSFRETSEQIQKRHFTREGKQWVIRPEIRQMVRFAHLNLISDIFPSPLNGTAGVDLIFCRNVLMYFDKETIQRIANQLESCLVPGGWLVTSQVELSEEYFGRFGKILHAGGFFYRRLEVNQPYVRKETAKLVTDDSIAARLPVKQTTSAVSPDLAKRSGLIKERASGQVKKTPILKDEPKKDLPAMDVAAVQHPSDRQKLREQISKLADKGQTEAALPLAKELCNESSADEKDYFLLASIQMAIGNYGEAEVSLTRALYLDPDFQEARFQLAFVEQKNGRHHEAQRQLKLLLKALDTMPSAQTVFAGMQVATLKEICKAALMSYEEIKR